MPTQAQHPILLAFLAAGLTLSACQSPGDDDDDSAATNPGPEPFDPSLYEILSHDLTESAGEAYRGSDNAEAVVQVARIWTGTPLVVHAVEAQFNVRSDDDQPAHVAIYPDFGTNFYDFGRDAPLVGWELELEKDEHDESWLLLPLEEPIVLNQPQLLFVGNHYRGTAGQPVLATDEVLSEDLLFSETMGEAAELYLQ